MEEVTEVQTVKKQPVILDSREIEVLKNIITGKTYRDISKSILRGESLAKHVAYGLFKKFGVNSREMLLGLAARNGIVYLDNSGNKHGVKLKLIEKLFVDASKENQDQGQDVPSNQTESVA